MHELKYLTYEGLSFRTYNALRRNGFAYIEDLLGTDPYNIIIAEGPEPWRNETNHFAPAGRLAFGWTQYEVGPGYDTWQAYRYRLPWSNIYGIGTLGIAQIQESLTRWKINNRPKYPARLEISDRFYPR